MAERVVTMSLPVEVADRIERLKVDQSYVSDVAVLQQVVQELGRESDPDFDRFMQEEVIPSYEEYLRDSSSALTSEQVAASIDATHREMLAELQLPKAG